MPGGRSRSAKALRCRGTRCLSAHAATSVRSRAEHVAADRVDVDLRPPDALARVDEERHARRPAERSHLLDRVDQSAVGAHVGERDEGDRTRFERPGQRADVEGAVYGARYHFDRRAGELAHLEEPEVVAVVGEAVDQQSVTARDACPECEPPHRLRPRLGVEPVSAISSYAQPISRDTAWRTSSSWGEAAVAASYPPRSASRRR